MQHGRRPNSELPVVGDLWIYPVKSLDGIQVDSVGFAASGSLLNDRRFCLMDTHGRLVNGKRVPEIHRIRSRFHLDRMQVVLWTASHPEEKSFDLEPENRELEEYLGEQLSQKVFLREDAVSGFLDDSEMALITLVSQASLDQVTQWFGWQDPGQALRRFRSNIVLVGPAAFAEDELVLQPGSGSEFFLGEAMFKAQRPCARCIVPPRDPETGEAIRLFEREFVRNRTMEYPGSLIGNAYGHAYMLSVCCTPREGFAGKMVRKGDLFRLI